MNMNLLPHSIYKKNPTDYKKWLCLVCNVLLLQFSQIFFGDQREEELQTNS